MVTWYVLMGTSCCIILLSLLIYVRKVRRNKPQPVPKTHNSQPAPFFSRRPQRAHHTIGILTPLPNSSAFHLKTGLIQQLESSPHATYTIRLFHGMNDRVKMFNQAVTCLQECDALIPFGLSSTNIAYEAARFLKSEVPVIFAGIKSHHIPLLRRQNKEEKLVGIISQRDSFTQVNQLRALKPKMKHVLILFRYRLEWLVSEVEEMTRYLDTLGIKTTTHVMMYGNHIDSQLSTIKESFDTILLMPHTLPSKALQELIMYCNLKNITLCASELDAVTLGAAIGFGGQEVTIGTRVGRIVRDVLEVKKPINEDTIMEHIDHYQVFVNQRALKKQNIKLKPELLFLLSQGEITHDKLMTNATTLPIGALQEPSTVQRRTDKRPFHPWGGS